MTAPIQRISAANPRKYENQQRVIRNNPALAVAQEKLAKEIAAAKKAEAAKNNV